MQYTISGKVIHGEGYGKKLGFPTVNLDVRNQVLPKAGVYAGKATVMLNTECSTLCSTFRAGIIIGPGAKVEAHLLDYSGDAYGKEVTLEVEKFLREFKKFDTEKELIVQIEKDLKMC